MPRPRKVPPVHVPTGSKYCFSCERVLPVLTFAKDVAQWDQLRPYCRHCDNAAAAARMDRLRRERRNMRLAAASVRVG